MTNNETPWEAPMGRRYDDVGFCCGLDRSTNMGRPSLSLGHGFCILAAR
jgi:hypothetical protein